MRIIYYLYQLCIALPLFIVLTILTSIVTIIGCMTGNGNFWGYWPGKIWSMVTLALFLIPVKVYGRENLQKGQSYVFVANHQGAIDIYLIYGHLFRNFKWMLKAGLRKIPFVGLACKKAGFIFIDHTSPSNIKASIVEAEKTLRDGMSLVVFPEGRRTFTGKVGPFKRGAFMIADELQLPVVPITINGSYDILPRQRGMVYFLRRHQLTMTIHEPIMPEVKGNDNINATMQRAREEIIKSLK